MQILIYLFEIDIKISKWDFQLHNNEYNKYVFNLFVLPTLLLNSAFLFLKFFPIVS